MTLIIEENKSLKAYNTFSIDVHARYFATVRTVAEVQTVLSNQPSTDMIILGGGSNILLTKNRDGLVIHNAILGIEKIHENQNHVFLKVGAGENWHQFVLYCIAHNYAGIENLSLIPGTVGAAPIQNIGAYGVEIKDVLECVDVIQISSGIMKTIFANDCQLSYRDSIFKQALKNKIIITHVTLRLNKNPIFHVEYGAIKTLLKNTPLSIKTISDAIIKIRQEKLPNPKIIGNAGSFFKNPLVPESLFLTIQKQYPVMPFFEEENATIKIPAGWLIEQCGFKGKRLGDVGVHANQALVLVNYGNGTGSDIKKLSETIQAAVLEKFGIRLMVEVNIL